MSLLKPAIEDQRLHFQIVLNNADRGALNSLHPRIIARKSADLARTWKVAISCCFCLQPYTFRGDQVQSLHVKDTLRSVKPLRETTSTSSSLPILALVLVLPFYTSHHRRFNTRNVQFDSQQSWPGFYARRLDYGSTVLGRNAA